MQFIQKIRKRFTKEKFDDAAYVPPQSSIDSPKISLPRTLTKKIEIMQTNSLSTPEVFQKPIPDVVDVSPGLYLYLFTAVYRHNDQRFSFEKSGAKYTWDERYRTGYICKYGMTSRQKTRTYDGLKPTLLCYTPLPRFAIRTAENLLTQYVDHRGWHLKDNPGKQSEGVFIPNVADLMELRRQYHTLLHMFMVSPELPFVTLIDKPEQPLVVKNLTSSIDNEGSVTGAILKERDE